MLRVDWLLPFGALMTSSHSLKLASQLISLLCQLLFLSDPQLSFLFDLLLYLFHLLVRGLLLRLVVSLHLGDLVLELALNAGKVTLVVLLFG